MPAIADCPLCGAPGGVHADRSGREYCLNCGATETALHPYRPWLWGAMGFAIASALFTIAIVVLAIRTPRQPAELPSRKISMAELRRPPLLEELPATDTHLTEEEGWHIVRAGTMKDWDELSPEAKIAVCRTWVEILHPEDDLLTRHKLAGLYFNHVQGINGVLLFEAERRKDYDWLHRQRSGSTLRSAIAIYESMSDPSQAEAVIQAIESATPERVAQRP